MSFNTVISYPIPAFQNLPIQPQFYRPRNFVISAIALGVLTTVTTTTNLDYVIGQLVRLIIPPRYGSRGLNERVGYVVVVSAPNEVIIDLDSNGVDPFIPTPVLFPNDSKTKPQILPVGDINNGFINNTGRKNQGTFIPGSFINISPS